MGEYGEPWVTVKSPHGQIKGSRVVAADKLTGAMAIYDQGVPESSDLSIKRFQRMVRCVNACEGIPDEALTRDIIGGVVQAMREHMSAVTRNCPVCGGKLRQRSSEMDCECGFQLAVMA